MIRGVASLVQDWRHRSTLVKKKKHVKFAKIFSKVAGGWVIRAYPLFSSILLTLQNLLRIRERDIFTIILKKFLSLY